MGKIRLLPEVLAHKIAAGEIVERPASVVKELLENALDAQATRITVRAENGGTRLIAVGDDGVGMSPEDARLAFEHHATSKISTVEDLSRIRTLGFRGEALPSIASVSRLRLRTSERAAAGESPLGTEIQYQGGSLQAVREISWPAGTEVLVEDLFFNVPARRKFLKTPATEFSHLSRQVVCYALAYPQVEFRFVHRDRPSLEAAPVATLRERAYQLLGESFVAHLVPVAYELEGIQVCGLTSLPHEQRSNAASQFLYVNRRMVRDRVLSHALHLAYRDLIPAGTYPLALLFLEIDPEQIDVNVHPCKTEIRFRDPNRVHRAIYHAAEQALLVRKGSGLAALARDLRPGEVRAPETAPFRPSPARSLQHVFQRHPDSSLGFPAFRGAGNGDADPHRSNIPETADLSPIPVVLGQFVESFIVAADREGIMVLDQHVAHERILYEQARRALESASGCPRQQLLVPLTLELTGRRQLLRKEILQALNENGFEVEWFGGDTLALKAVPAPASGCDVERLIREILDSLEPEDAAPGFDLERLREKIALALSCRAAIKINTPLTPEKMQWLIDRLFRCQSPYTCPHGRPIMLRLNIEDLLRGFKRI